MSAKPKVAICWLGGCGGCDEAIVDLNEALLDFAENVDIVLWPLAMDFKYSTIEAMQDGEIAMSILSGSVRNSEHREMAELLRKKSELIVAFGACAGKGGTPGLANFSTKQAIFDWVYRDAPSLVNPSKTGPQPTSQLDGKTLTLPDFLEHLYPLDQVVEVDYAIPGCPPPSDLIGNAFNAVLTGDLPPRGATIGSRKALCETCVRNKRKPERIEIRRIVRIHEVEADPDICFLEQGIICMGPATRGGCGEACININVPCRGCFGPVPGVSDIGTKYLSALASLLKAEADEEIIRLIDSIVDPAGYFYRFTQPSSVLGRMQAEKRMEV